MKKWYLHVDVKADVKQQEIKGLVAESYNFLKEVSWNLEFFYILDELRQRYYFQLDIIQ